MKLTARFRSFRTSAIVIALAVIGSLLVLLPSSPINMPLTYRDSGMFLYAGWQILEGKIPYRDVWDLKPPVIFYLNAAGLAIANNSRWGVWLIETAFLSFTVLTGFSLMRDAFGALPAIISSSVWLLSLVFVIDGGNLTEEYALPLVFGCFWLVYNAEKRGSYRWYGYLIGVLCGIAFFTKQNTIGIGFSIILYMVLSSLLSHHKRKLLTDLLLVICGGLTVVVIIISYFAVYGAVHDFWKAAFVYDFVYCTRENLLKSIISVILTGFQLLSITKIITFALAGWGTGLFYLILKRKVLDKNIITIIAIGVIDLPIELLLVSTSGRTYPHYYMMLLPVSAILAGLLVHVLIKGLMCIFGSPPSRKAILVISFFIFLSFAPTYIKAFAGYRDYMRALSAVQADATINYIRENTSDHDYILMWGAEPVINFFARRASPSRFVYHYPLYTPNYTTRDMVEEFLRDIHCNKPALIIDTLGKGIAINNFGITSPKIDELLEFIRLNYQVKKKLGSWVVYAYVGDR